MSIKKIIKYIFIGIIVILIGKFIISEFFDKKPFEFGKYRTSSELRTALKLKFPIGSAVDQIVAILKKSDATCFAPVCDGPCSDFEARFYCKYATGLFSLHPWESYAITLYMNKERKLTRLTAKIFPGILGTR